jgi:succinoglycan biosynthesis protein ExoO
MVGASSGSLQHAAEVPRGGGPKFSVIIPVYNGARELPRSVGSVLRQTDQDFEIIVVNDASTDESLAVAHAAADDRIRVVDLPPPSHGPGFARNAGLALARGRWIAFLDADDEWLPDHLAQVAAAILAHVGVRMFGCGSLGTHDGGKTTRRDRFGSDPRYRSRATLTLSQYLEACLAGRQPLNTNTVIADAALVRSLTPLFPEERTVNQDLVAWVRLLSKAGTLVRLPHVAALSYRSRPTSSSSSGALVLPIWTRLVAELAPTLDARERWWLKRYANRNLCYGYRANYLKGHSNPEPVWRYLYGNREAWCVLKTLAVVSSPRWWARAVVGVWRRLRHSRRRAGA